MALTITRDSYITDVYGDSDRSFTLNISGCDNDDDADDLDAPGSSQRQMGENAGTYTITPSGAADTNYVTSYVTSDFSIIKATLTITEDSCQTKRDRESDPSFTFTI